MANAVRCSSTVRSPAPIVFTATWVAPGQVYHDVQKLVGADTAVGSHAVAMLRAHQAGAAAQLVTVGAPLGRDLLPSLAGSYQIHGFHGSLPQ